MTVWRRHSGAARLLALVSFLGLAPMAFAQAQKVTSIEVKGNANISRDAIVAALTRTRIGADFSQQQLDEDVRSIRKLGWFYQVNPLVEPGADGVKVVIGVVEHPKVTAIQITGNTKFTEAELAKLVTTQVGTVFNETVFQRDVEAIEKHYRANEYRLARVTEEVDITPEGVVKIPIAEGWIEEIRVEGLKKTKQYIVLRELDTKPGEVFYGKKLQDDLQRLRNLDFFETMDPQIAEGSEPGKVKLALNVKEKKTGTVSVGLGYSSRDRLVGFADVTEHNFRGRGQQIGVRWEAGQFTNRSGYEFSFTDPWALGKRTSLGLRLYDAATNRPLVVGLPTAVTAETAATADSTDPALTDQEAWISERRRGFGVSVGRPIGRHGRALLDFRSDDVESLPVDDLLATNQEDYLRDWLKGDEGRVTSITLRGIRNTRDYDINPARGALHSVSVELAGGPLGGDWSYSKVGMDLRRYFPVGRAKPDGSNQKVFAVRLMGGVGIGKLSLSENYWIGGAESLRGYREDQFHGSRSLLLSSELRIPFGTSLQGVTFFDYGYAWSSGQGVALGDMMPAVGLGLRVVTPLGPLRLDYGFGKDGGRSHFSIGHVF